MKLDTTTIAIIVFAIIVIAIPAGLYAADQLSDKTPRIADFCNANGYWRVDPCIDGSFQAIKEPYTEGFSIVRPDGSGFSCPFTLPQYQVGECIDYTTGGACGYMGNICEENNACVSDLDCAGECINWSCS